MGFVQKIEFDAWLISSTIELTHVQVLGSALRKFYKHILTFLLDVAITNSFLLMKSLHQHQQLLPSAGKRADW